MCQIFFCDIGVADQQVGDADGSMCEFSKTCLFNQVASQDNSSNTFWVARFLATDPASSWINKQLKWTFMFAGKCLTVVTAYSA